MMKRLTIRYLLAPLGLLALACSSDTGEIQSFEDEGLACVRSADDGRLEVEAEISACHPCGRVLDRSCSVTVEGQQVVVTSHAAVELAEGACTADCAPIIANCSSEALEPGKYEMTYGEEIARVDVPGEQVVQLGGELDGC